MKNKFNFIERTTKLFFCLAIIAIAFNSCKDAFDHDLPDTGSIEDTIPPTANFSYASSIDDFKTIKFGNLSFESISYSWDFGGGNTSVEEDPSFTFAAEGTYPVTLTASDGRGESNSITIDVVVAEGPFQPVIVEPGFEDNTLPDGTGDGRDSWRKSELGGVIQITSSPVTFGDQGAKMPDDQSRVGYQEIVVEPNSVYDLRFWYTMLDNSTDPYVTVSIVGVTQNGGAISTTQEALDNTIGSVTVNDTSDPDEYLEQKLTFDSKDNDVVAIYFFNGPVEARLDDFSIEVGTPGAVPPSAGFDITQSAADFLEYTFTNTSTDGESYAWDFGDGNTSTDESPTHVYATHDTYTVTLEVTNASGLSATLEKPIDIQAPVTADFTFVTNQIPDTYQTVQFMDASVGAVELLWEFGDGYQFTGMNPSHTYMADDIYTVTLTATSITGLQDVTTMEVTVVLGFIASIKESSFEDDDPSGAACGTALDGRDCWRQSDLGGVIQITSGPTVTGGQAAKLPNDGTRIGYQRVEVEANKEYTVTFNYTMKTDPGTLTFSILDDSVLTDPSEVAAATITSTTVSDNSDPDTYVTETIVFNSGSLTEIAVFFTNLDTECRLDDISIMEN